MLNISVRGRRHILGLFNSESKTMSVLYQALKFQKLFHTFGVIPDDIIINFTYKSLRKNSS